MTPKSTRPVLGALPYLDHCPELHAWHLRLLRYVNVLKLQTQRPDAPYQMVG